MVGNQVLLASLRYGPRQLLHEDELLGTCCRCLNDWLTIYGNPLQLDCTFFLANDLATEVISLLH